MLAVGLPAPDFELPNQDGQPVRLSDYRGRKVVLFAFPRAGTSGCNAQACGFRDEFEAFQTHDAVVLGVSGDSPAALRRWKQAKGLPYDLLSDPGHTMLAAWGAFGIQFLGLIHIPMIQRSCWVIDEHGTIIDMQSPAGPKESVQRALAGLHSHPVHLPD